ncbi:MAG: DUF2357 domain-containing protein [Burkholderiaceae bacterium]
MIRLREARSDGPGGWLSAPPDACLCGLTEDTDYLIDTGRPGATLCIDDIELTASTDGLCRWRPGFYAGRVTLHVVATGGVRTRYALDIGPSPSKSGADCFADMVAAIRHFDQALLGGTSEATMAFGRAGQPGRYADAVLLARMRQHGPGFLDALVNVARAPHRSVCADLQMLPLSRIRRLHPGALRDRRVAALAGASADPTTAFETIRIHSLTSVPTFDTPANRALLGLLQRFRATLIRLGHKVQALGLGGPQEEQAQRVGRRMIELQTLGSRVDKLLMAAPFIDVSNPSTTAAGLTQVAAQPKYGRAYRLGCRALTCHVDGQDDADELHVNHSWGIYETWCYLAVLEAIGKAVGVAPVAGTPRAVTAELAYTVVLPQGGELEILFQGVFPSSSPWAGRSGWSISRERRPDIVLVARRAGQHRAMVLDAKWRSGKNNVLAAMESAHLYHDALRIAGGPPSPCLLLLPGAPSVAALEEQSFIDAHGVGAISHFSVGGAGLTRLEATLKAWLLSA